MESVNDRANIGPTITPDNFWRARTQVFFIFYDVFFDSHGTNTITYLLSDMMPTYIPDGYKRCPTVIKQNRARLDALGV